MERCKTCGFWQKMTLHNCPLNEPVDTPGNTGSCSCDRFSDHSEDRAARVGVENKDGIYTYPAVHRGISMWDDEGFAVHFATDEDFGCVNWKPKG